MEVFFLDVGQGTCQIILLGNRTAIVVDCGTTNDRIALQFLKRYGVEFIPCLIISHSHNDHIGGATSILADYQDRIEGICFVQDDKFLNSKFWARISEMLKLDRLNKTQLVRLERTESPQVVWSNPPSKVRLTTYSPSAGENLLAQEAGEQNPTSAVLFFECGKNRIIFAADSQVEQWKEIHSHARRRINCNVLAVPHHAGRTHHSLDDLNWLFETAVRPQVAVISVGTSNTHDHPREDVIGALKAAGATVLCTQITRKCCANLESLRPGVLQPVTVFGRSSPTQDLTTGLNSRNVACAGTVLASLAEAELQVDRVEEHQAAIDKLATLSHGCPLCR